MKIVIDARWIFEQISGIGQYTQELIRHLVRIDRDNHYVLLFDHPRRMERTAAATRFDTADRFEARQVDYGLFSLRSQATLPGLLRELGADVFHSPNYMIPLRAFPRDRAGPVRCVVTLHDVIPLAVPDHAPRSRKRRLFPLYKMLMKEIGRRADLILTVSEASRADVLRHLAVPAARADQVRVIPNGVSDVFTPVLEEPRPRPPTVLYVGRFDPYKNLESLVEAMARVRARVPDAVLRVIGPPDPRYPEPRERARALEIDDAVEWIGYAADEDLVDAYREADVFALPSRYEGFGLPVLEAMASGTPVVCGNRSSLPEVAGEAALLVDPDAPADLADAIVRVLTDPTLAADLRARGRERAAAFTWTRCAEQTLDAYRDAAGNTAHPSR